MTKKFLLLCALAIFPFSATALTTVVSDTFTDTGNTEIDAHTPDTDTVGNGWSKLQGCPITGDCKIGSGGTTLRMINGYNHVSIDSGEGDVTITFDVVTINRGAGPFCRNNGTAFGSGGNGWRVTVDDEAGASALILERYDSGTPTTVDSDSTIVVATDTLKMECIGSNIKFYVNDVEKLAGTETSYGANTRVGVFDGINTGLEEIDNFLVTTGSTTTWTDDTVDVGTTIQGTLDVAFSGAITKCVFASGDELTASNADTDSADCAQTKADFLSGGSLSNTRIASATTASMDNASETSTADTFTFNSPDNGTTEHFGTAGNASPDPDSLYSDSDFTTEYSSFDSNADDVWVTVQSGTCDFEPVQGIFECTVVPATGVVRVYDVSATDWLTESNWTVTSPQGDCQLDVVLSPLVRPIIYSPISQIFCN